MHLSTHVCMCVRRMNLICKFYQNGVARCSKFECVQQRSEELANTFIQCYIRLHFCAACFSFVPAFVTYSFILYYNINIYVYTYLYISIVLNLVSIFVFLMKFRWVCNIKPSIHTLNILIENIKSVYTFYIKPYVNTNIQV